MKPSRINPIWVIFFVVLLDLLGFGIVIPILPLLFTDPGSKHSLLGHTLTLQQGYILFGLLIATYPFFQFFTAPVWGQLADRYGRRKLLIASMLGVTFSNGLFAAGLIVQSIPLLFLSKALSGIAGGNLSIAQAIVADLYPPEKRTKQFGLLGSAFGIGLIMGPYLGGKLSDSSAVSWFSINTPFIFATILSLLSTLSVVFLLPETLKPEDREKGDARIDWLKSVTTIFKAYELDDFRVVFVVGFLFQASFAFFTTFINVFLYKHFRFNEKSIGEFFAYAGLWIAFTQLFVTKYTHKRFTDKTVIKYALFLYTVFIIDLFLVRQAWQLYILAAFFAVANGLIQTSMIGYVSSKAHENMQGRILGMNSSIIALAQMIPPLVSGFLAASLSANAPIVAAAVFSGLAGLLFLKEHEKKVV